MSERAWIDCVLDIAAREPEGEHITSHWVLCHKVLGESSLDALGIAARFRGVRLT